MPSLAQCQANYDAMEDPAYWDDSLYRDPPNETTDSWMPYGTGFRNINTGEWVNEDEFYSRWNEE